MGGNLFFKNVLYTCSNNVKVVLDVQTWRWVPQENGGLCDDAGGFSATSR